MQEIRSAIRSLRRTAGFTTTVIAMLALGIAGSTAVFSVVNHVLLQPLPYQDAGQLVRLYQRHTGLGEDRVYVTGFAYRGYREQMSSLESVAASYTYRETGVDLTTASGAERLRALPVSASYFDVLRAAPLIGRVFTAEEESLGSGAVILSHEMWQRRFGGDASVVGSVLRLSGEPYTVVGIAPPGLTDPVVGSVDVWQPLNAAADVHPQNHHLTVLGRLRPGITLVQAAAEIASVDRALATVEPAGADRPSQILALHEDLVGGASRTLYVLLGAVGLLLLIACVNVANLMIARAMVRERELAVRAALGAGRGRLLGQLLTESLLLAAAGGVAGVTMGMFLLDLLISLGSGSVPRLEGATMDARVLAFAVAISVIAAILFGLVPALRFSRAAMAATVRDATRSVTANRRRARVRAALVGAQIALAFMLLVGASALTLGMYRLTQVNLGFDESNVLTFEVHLPALRYDAARRAQFHEEFADRVVQMPGVVAAGAVSRLPATGRFHSWGSRPLTGPRAGEADGFAPSEQRVVSGDYFDAMRIPLLQGRLFDDRDGADVPRVVVVSRSIAEDMFAGADPLGQRLNVIGDEVTVIGVVDDVARDVEGEIAGAVYHAHSQYAGNRNWALTQVVRTQSEPTRSVRSVRELLRTMDPELVLYRPATLDDVLGRGIAQRRFTTWLMTGFAALAVLLATTGLFGVVAYVVRQRTRELGIRVALGARPHQIRAMVVGQGLRVAAGGILLGLVGSFALGRVISALAYQTDAADPLVLAGAALLMATVAAGAAWLPAREATRVDPRQVLSSD